MRGLALLCVALAPAAASAQALNVSGDVSGGYSRTDSGGTGAHATGTTWDWGGRLALSGSPFNPGVLDMLLAGDYRDFRTVYDSADTQTRVLGLHSSASILGDSVVPMHLSVSRSYSDFLTDIAGDRTGHGVVTNIAAGAVLRQRDYPTLVSSLSRTDYDTTSPAGTRTVADSTRLSLGASQALGNHHYSIAYDTGWDHGDYVDSDYRSHSLLIDYSGAVDDGTLVRLTDRYYLRAPTQADPRNLRFENNSLATGVQWRAFRDGNAAFSYGYRQASVTSAGTEDGQFVSHSASQRLFLPWGTNVSFQGDLAASYGYERRGVAERRAAAQSIGATVNWTRPSPRATLHAGAGTVVGVVEPDVGDVTASLGVTGTIGIMATSVRFSPSATYSIAYQDQGADLAGWTLQQRLDLSARGYASRAVYLHASLSFSDYRREDDVTGTSELRAATLLVSANMRRASAQVTAGVSESLGSGLGAPGDAQPVIVTAEYNTRTWYATLSATRYWWQGRLWATALARTLDITAPGRPEQWEHGASVSASVLVGQLVFTAEDRASLAEAGASSRYANLVFVRLTRNFGMRVR